MPATTLFRRLALMQAVTVAAVVLVVGAVFYVERNRTVARLVAERWAPALREAASLPPVAPRPRADVAVRTTPPPATLPSQAWAPRIAMLRETLREAGVPVVDVRFGPGRDRPTTWLLLRTADGQERWLGIEEELVESHVVWRVLLALGIALAIVATASGLAARHLARPLEALRRRIEAHDDVGAATPHAPGPEPAPAGATQEIVAIESAWVALRERLARQDSERALLLAGVSHDLRSPLARIRMAAELLPEDAPDVGPRRAAIVRNVEVADRLVASFLDYVRAAELPLDQPVDVAALARRWRLTRDEPPDVLGLEAPPRLDVSEANALLLERVLGNLVDNALRHGHPPVRVHVHRQGADVCLDVEDHGDGIPPERRDEMVRAFARGDASRGSPGTGLGLAVVDRAAGRLGGTLVFSIEGGVHRARVRWPARHAHDPSPPVTDDDKR